MPVKGRLWTFMLMKKDELTEVSWVEVLKNLEAIDCIWMVFQTEVAPTTKRVHAQGCLAFQTPRTMLGTKKRFPDWVHLEMARGTALQNLTYCTKTESRQTGPLFYNFSKGTMPVQGARVDIAVLMEYAKQHTVSQCWQEHPVAMFRYHHAVKAFKWDTMKGQVDQPQVTILWGPTGTGKSYRALMEATESGDKQNGTLGDHEYFSMVTPTAVGSTPWMDGYSGEKHVIIEDFDGTIQYRILLRMLDRYRNLMQIKGGAVQFAPNHIWITSNKHPSVWYPTELYEDGPLQRRLEKDNTGNIIHMTHVWKGGITNALGARRVIVIGEPLNELD